jgi:hypothetical protein
VSALAVGAAGLAAESRTVATIGLAGYGLGVLVT